jgi:hypothetical protein
VIDCQTRASLSTLPLGLPADQAIRLRQRERSEPDGREAPAWSDQSTAS